MNNTPEQILNTKDLTNKHGDSPDGKLIHVSVNLQQLALYAHDQLLQRWPVSTALNGIGNRNGSFKTPTGIHRIAEMIGDGTVPGTVFKGRVATDQCVDPDARPSATDEDLITSRILWLQGLEPGINQGGEVDSHQRYIYIHGTANEARIGEPVSQGCIRMTNTDVITLFEQVKPGTLVVIHA
ncbi:MAG TPA: L,D-transpeptidase [Gammaproteobacteria bacterium]|nr:L,D-transpeptidase [Gammaproteobacteria bacterium]